MNTRVGPVAWLAGLLPGDGAEPLRVRHQPRRRRDPRGGPEAQWHVLRRDGGRFVPHRARGRCRGVGPHLNTAVTPTEEAQFTICL